MLGWIICKEWPSFGEATTRDDKNQPLDKRLRLFEDELFEDREKYQMSMFKDKEASDESRQDNREHARAARNFVWLLYGLVPSLPAVIHTHIMGLIYHAELSLRSIDDVVNSDDNVRKDILDNARKWYQESLDEMKEWAELVGKLSAILRYVWVKYLHLHIGLALQCMRKQSTEDHATAFWRRYGYEIPPKEVLSTFKCIEQLFVDNQGRELATDLAIMPDLASLTLFGEHWLAYEIERLDAIGKISLTKSESYRPLRDDVPQASGTSSDLPDPFSRVSGVFAETELWLWATNRFLRKLRGEVNRKYEEH